MMYKTHDDLPESLQGIHKVFRKPELVNIAGELGMDASKMNIRRIVLAIANDLDKNGIPEDDECSDDLYDFLVEAGYIDEDGNILEFVESGGDDDLDDEPEPIEDVPECFTFAEHKDPACSRCVLFDNCYAERVASRPLCFGKHWDMNAEECRICLEFNACRKATEVNKEM